VVGDRRLTGSGFGSLFNWIGDTGKFLICPPSPYAGPRRCWPDCQNRPPQRWHVSLKPQIEKALRYTLMRCTSATDGYLTGVYLIDVHLMGVYVYLTGYTSHERAFHRHASYRGVYLIGVHLISVHLIGACISQSMHLMGVHLRRASHRLCIP